MFMEDGRGENIMATLCIISYSTQSQKIFSRTNEELKSEVFYG